MPAIEVGRVCIKNCGRETGNRCVVLDVIDKNFVLITGPKQISGVRRRRVNVNHIKPTEEKIKIERGAADEEVARILSGDVKTERRKRRKSSKID